MACSAGNNNNTLDGSPFMFVDSDAAGSGNVLVDEMLYSPVFNTAGQTQLFISIDQYYRHLGTGSFGAIDVF